MRYKTRQFIFHQAYEMASLVEDCVINSSSFIELDWESKNVINCLNKFSRISLLHYYIYAMISVEERHNFRNNYDLFEDSEEMVADVENNLHKYGIDFLPYSEYLSQNKNGLSDDDYLFLPWTESQEKSFEQLWKKITDEVFHLLFTNRTFLLRFNQSLATYLKSREVDIPTKYIDKKGVIKRQSYFPAWVKKAVYYCDQGRCVLCQQDLTGLLSTDQRIHYDHIVPLNLWGTNDPCNIQLLCENCNLRKSGTSAQTATRYHPWWDY